jgi:hypothetical protein
MFKRLALALCVGSLSMSPALAQQEDNTAKMFIAKQPCDVFQKMIDTVKDYEEDLLFLGEGMSFAAQSGKGFMGGMMFFTNQETGTWSMLQLYGDGTACLVMNGRGFVPYGGPKMPEGIEH